MISSLLALVLKMMMMMMIMIMIPRGDEGTMTVEAFMMGTMKEQPIRIRIQKEATQKVKTFVVPNNKNKSKNKNKNVNKNINMNQNQNQNADDDGDVDDDDDDDDYYNDYDYNDTAKDDDDAYDDDDPNHHHHRHHWPLQEYMKLPAAQYACVPMPLKASLERVYGSADEFMLRVPTISFPISKVRLEIEPKVRAKVEVDSDKVTIQSVSCSIEGSPAVEEWKLNELYDLDVRATLTWEKKKPNLHSYLNFIINDDCDGDGDDCENGNDDNDNGHHPIMVGESRMDATKKSFSSDTSKTVVEPAPAPIPGPTTTRENENELGATDRIIPTATTKNKNHEDDDEYDAESIFTIDPVAQDVIRIMTELSVDVYPPQINRIQMIPKRLLAKIGNMALKYAVGLLLEAFLQGLREDYEKWATDESYQNDRRKLEQELQTELDEIAELNERKRRRRAKEEEGKGGGAIGRRRRRSEENDDSNGGGGAGTGGRPNININDDDNFGTTGATAATAASPASNHRRRRPGERIIRLIVGRKNKRSSVS